MMLWVVVAAGFTVVIVLVVVRVIAVVIAASLIVMVVVGGLIGYTVTVCAYHQLILDVIPQVVLNVCQQLAS